MLDTRCNIKVPRDVYECYEAFLPGHIKGIVTYLDVEKDRACMVVVPYYEILKWRDKEGSEIIDDISKNDLEYTLDKYNFPIIYI